MKAVIRYIAADGSEWLTEDKALERDALSARCQALHDRLGPVVKRGRRQVDPANVAAVKRDTVQLCRVVHPNEAVFQHPAADIHPMSYAGRFLNEVGGPLDKLWYRFCCINGEWEYEQPFFAINPDKFNPKEARGEG